MPHAALVAGTLLIMSTITNHEDLCADSHTCKGDRLQVTGIIARKNSPLFQFLFHLPATCVFALAGYRNNQLLGLSFDVRFMSEFCMFFALTDETDLPVFQ